MPHRQETIRFPGATAYVETFDTGGNDAEPADILSFESLRKAFATLQSAEQAIPELESLVEKNVTPPELPDYDIDHELLDSEDDWSPSFKCAEPPVSVGTRLETIIEAMLFVGNQDNRPLAADTLAEKLRNVSIEEVDQAICQLNDHYQERNCPFAIVSERGGYRMVLRPEFEPVRTNFYGKVRGTRLSQQAIDTLAVVAYRQPITAEEVQHLRKRSSSPILNQLVRRNLLKISREVQNEKNIVRYHTTPRFLELLQIQSLSDIPHAEELDYR